MLTCRHKDTNKRIEINNNKAELKSLSKLRLLNCPDCFGILIFKSGEHKRPHFAHKGICPYPYGEPESDEHINGKIALKDMLIRLFPDSKVYLEYKVDSTNQRSDVIVIKPDNTKLAFEMQCSKISGETWLERHNLYKQAGIKDYWILGNSLFRKIIKNEREKLCINDFISEILSHHDYISACFLDIENKQFNLIFDGYFEERYTDDYKMEKILLSEIKIYEDQLLFPNFRKYYLGFLEFCIKQDEEDRQREIEFEKKNKEESEKKAKIELFTNLKKEVENKYNIKIYSTIFCENCDSPIHGRKTIRMGKYGLFLGCSEFPKCYNSSKLYECDIEIAIKCIGCNLYQEITKIDNYYAYQCKKCLNQIRIYQNINNEEELQKLIRNHFTPLR